ncbi:MAG: hypothetical protein WC637_07015 [Victivallales bacterium]|jgi:hypothetical protein
MDSDTTTNKVMNSCDNQVWDEVYVPGIAYEVYLEIASMNGEDSLQKAVLGLLRLSPGRHSAELMCADLGISEVLLRQVLRHLIDQQSVVEQDGLFANAKSDGEEIHPVQKINGWVFWDAYGQRFLETVLIDLSAEKLKKFLGMKMRRKNCPCSSNLRPKLNEMQNALLSVLRAGDCSIFQTSDENGNFLINEAVGLSVQRVLLRDNDFECPLLVPVEVRARLSSEPALIFHNPQLMDISMTQPVPDAHIKEQIKQEQSEDFEHLYSNANKFNLQFLKNRHADVLANLGGVDMIRADARNARDRELSGCVKSSTCFTDELLATAEDAEESLLLLRQNIGAEPVVRRNFEHVLQLLARLVGEEMADFFEVREHFKALQQAAQDISNAESRKKWALIRCQERCRKLSIDLGGFHIETHLKEIDRYPNIIKDTGCRHQLGYAFTLWLLPAFLDVDTDSAKAHVDKIRHAFHTNPSFGDMLANTIKQRILDKETRDGNTYDGLPVLAVKRNVYSIWKVLS